MMRQDKPKISVFTPSKNSARFLRETIESILSQTFTDYEHVVFDGASTDETIDILKEYSHLRWISEPDEGRNDGFRKALAMTRGEYVMCCCISDGYLSRNWFQQCVDILDNDPEVSLVYGLSQYMREDGSLGRIAYAEFFDDPPPQKMNFLPFWLANFFYFPEINYCARADAYKKCLPPADSSDYLGLNNACLRFVYNFNTSGYLSYFLPTVASYGRIHSDSGNTNLIEILDKTTTQYVSEIIKYRNDILSGAKQHVFRDGNSRVIKTINQNELTNLRKEILQFRINNRLLITNDYINLYLWKKAIKLLFTKGGIKKLSNKLMKSKSEGYVTSF